MVPQWALLIICFAGLLTFGQWTTLWHWTQRMTFSTIGFVGNGHLTEGKDDSKSYLAASNEPWSQVSFQLNLSNPWELDHSSC